MQKTQNYCETVSKQNWWPSCCDPGSYLKSWLISPNIFPSSSAAWLKATWCNGKSLAFGLMQFVLSPLLLHLYFISHVSHCINSCGLFLPSADAYFSLPGFVIITRFLLAALSIDNVLHIFDRCWSICSWDMMRRVITALFSSLANKQTHFLPGTMCVSLLRVMFCIALTLRTKLWFTLSSRYLSAPFHLQLDPLSVEYFPLHTLSFTQYPSPFVTFLHSPFLVSPSCYHYSVSGSALQSSFSIITWHFTLH